MRLLDGGGGVWLANRRVCKRRIEAAIIEPRTIERGCHNVGCAIHIAPLWGGRIHVCAQWCVKEHLLFLRKSETWTAVFDRASATFADPRVRSSKKISRKFWISNRSLKVVTQTNFNESFSKFGRKLVKFMKEIWVLPGRISELGQAPAP